MVRVVLPAKEEGESVVMMTTGWRNVPSTANVLYDIVVEEINLTLAHKGLPTIINVKLPRLRRRVKITLALVRPSAIGSILCRIM